MRILRRSAPLAVTALALLIVPVLTLVADDKKPEPKKEEPKKEAVKKDEPKKDEPKPAAPAAPAPAAPAPAAPVAPAPAAPAPAAPAGDAVELKWKFEKDKTFYQEMTTDTKQTMKVMGMEVVQNQKQTFIFSWTPEKQDDNKNWVIKQKIEGIKMDIEIGGNKFSYDSTKDTTTSTNPLAEFFKAIVGSEFKLTVSPELKVTAVSGREEFLKKLINANQQMEPLLKTILSDEAVKQMADPAFAPAPGKPVKVKESWDRKSTLNMGPIGNYENTYKYTLEGKDDKNKNLERIKVETGLKYNPPADAAGGGLPFKIKSANLASKDASGFALFDTAKGRLDSSEMTLKLEGSLEIEIGNQPTKVELVQTQKTTLKTTDENPAGKKSLS